MNGTTATTVSASRGEVKASPYWHSPVCDNSCGAKRVATPLGVALTHALTGTLSVTARNRASRMTASTLLSVTSFSRNE